MNFRTDFLRQQVDYVYVLDGGGPVIASNDSMAVAGRLFEPFHCDTGSGRCEVRGWPEYLEMCGASRYAVRNIALYRGNTTTYGVYHEWTKKLPPGDGKSKNLYCVISIQESMQKGPPAVFRVSGKR